MSMVDPEGRGLPLNMRHVARRNIVNTAPTATSPAITGGAIVGVQQTGTYTYADAQGDLEGTSTYRWLLDGVAIGGATAITYTPVGSDYGHTLTFEVTPVAASGLSPGGAATSAGSVVTFTTASISNMIGWYDGADISSLWKDAARSIAVTTTGDIVLGVSDKSGAGKHLSVAANGPAYTTGAVNGLSALRFDGTNDVLGGSETADGSQTWVIVAKKRSAPGGASRYAFATSSNAALFTNSGVDANKWCWFSNNAGASVVIAGNAANTSVIVLRVNSAASMDAWVDGGAAVNFDPQDAVTTDTAFNIGASIVPGSFGDYDICEVLHVSDASTLAVINRAGAYCGAKWGSTWSTAS